MGSCSLTHAIRVPTHPESCIFVFILGDNIIVTPPAGSFHFPCSFSSDRSEVIQSAESSIILCLLRNSVKPRTSLRCSLQNSCLVLLYEQQFQPPKSKLCQFFDHILTVIVARRCEQFANNCS